MSHPLNYRSPDEENNSTGADENVGEEEGEGGEEGGAEETDSDSERLFREALRQEKYRQRKRKLSGDGGGGDGGEDDSDSVPGQIPIDILRLMSPLCEKMGITMRQQLGLTMGFVELCGELKYTCYFIQMTFYD